MTGIAFKGKILPVEAGQETVRFHVQGSAKAPYEVLFINRGEGNITALCTCQAGGFGMYCKHRFQMLQGDVTHMTAGEDDDLRTLQRWIAGSDIEQAMQALATAEAALKAAKKELARLMELRDEAEWEYCDMGTEEALEKQERVEGKITGCLSRIEQAKAAIKTAKHRIAVAMHD